MKRYIITTAVPGAKLNEPFAYSLRNYAKRQKAKIVVLVSPKLYKDDQLDPRIAGASDFAIGPINLQTKLYLSGMPIAPEAVDPVAGLERLDGSFVFASPKQRLKSVAKTGHLPRVLMTPGAITKPYYRDTRRGIVAGSDHVDGAIIVEVVGPEEYHFRQVQADHNGHFIDLGVEYGYSSTWKAGVAALTPGDWHVGSTDPLVRKVVFKLIEEFKPEQVVLHDTFDGLSVNHHIEEKTITRGRMGDMLSLDKELNLYAKELKQIADRSKNVVVVRSNHDEFLDRWLEAGKYVSDPMNLLQGLELALAKAQGQNPLEYATRKRAKLSNVQFLAADDELRITKKKIQCAVHGHMGPNGSRGSAGNLEKVYGNAITGHTHTPEILRGLYVVGTSTTLKLDYTSGPSSWLQSLCVTYNGGSRQLINVIGGRWKG